MSEDHLHMFWNQVIASELEETGKQLQELEAILRMNAHSMV